MTVTETAAMRPLSLRSLGGTHDIAEQFGSAGGAGRTAPGRSLAEVTG